MASASQQGEKDLYKDGAPNYCKQRTQPLEVLCVGFSRTGTSSLYDAFHALGYGTMYSSRETGARNQWHYFKESILRKYFNTGPNFTLEQFESLWGEYTVISGELVAAHAEELLTFYPNAKVILTVRDEQLWLRSMEATLWYNKQAWSMWLLKLMDPWLREARAGIDLWWKALFFDDLPRFGLAKYREQAAMVRRCVPPERLLVFDTAEGWEPLCRFLGKDVPDVAFPHVNPTAQHRALFDGIRRTALKRALARWTGRASVPVLILLMIWKRKGLRYYLDSLLR